MSNFMKRDHGYYWITVNDAPLSRSGVTQEYVAEWAYLGAVGEEVWFLAGDQDYRFDTEVTVRSGRLSEPGNSILSRLRDFAGFRDARRNYRLY